MYVIIGNKKGGVDGIKDRFLRERDEQDGDEEEKLRSDGAILFMSCFSFIDDS